MMSQFMAQGGQGISGKAIKWRKTSVNVPFSLFSGNFKMFLNVFGPIVTALLAARGGRHGGSRGREENTSTRLLRFLRFYCMRYFFSSLLHGKK